MLCYLGEADGKYSGDMARWNEAGEFFETLARWIEGRHQPLPDDLLLTQEIRDGVCVVQLHLDPARKGELFSTLPRVRVLHGLPGTPPAKETVSLQWKTADLLETVLPLSGRETILNTVEIAGQPPVILPAACLPYSPEYAPDQTGRGAATLTQIATTTGGRERIEIPKIWGELPVKSRYVELAPWLLVLATLLFLLEVLERRTGWLARLFRLKSATVSAETTDADITEATPELKPIFAWLKRKPVPPKKSPGVAKPAAAPTTGNAPTTPEQPPAEESAVETLLKARNRANRRRDKER